MRKATPICKRAWLIVVLAMLMAMVCMFSACKKPTGDATTPPVTSELYWNLDKALYTDNDIGLSTRERAEDGLYHFRFASTGKLVELTTDDAQIVNYIDTLEVMGLILDDAGSIIDAVPIAELAVEVAKEFFVKKVSGSTIQLNSSPAMNGMDVEIVIPETAYVMDVRTDSENPAQSVTLDVMDSVWVYADQNNVVTNVFLSKRPPASEFYVRMDRFYANGETTRVPDKDGVYTIPFAVNGKIVELKCKDKDMVSSIDSGTDTGAHMGLVFDEEGYIIEDMSGAEALRCAATAVVFHVKEINGDQVTFLRKLPGSSQGQEVTLTVNENTQIINTEQAYMSDSCWAFEKFGELTDHLEVDDRVICYADSDGNAKVVTILCRMVDAKMYFNQSVMYNSTEKTTTRVPNEEGYYVYTFACEGKEVTLKTKSKAVATKVDSYTSGVVGLKVSGSIIKDACSPYCVAGWNVTAKLIAREMLGTVVTLTSRWNIESVGGNYVIADGCKTFDVSGNYGVKFGAKTTVQVGDHVYGVRNPYGELSYIFVTKRLVSGTKLYYNTWRRYNTTTGETTRPADAEGYYVYDLLTETGKLVQGKTKDKQMADFIDKQLSPFVSLKINSSGIITKAAFCEASLQWGMKYTNYHYIADIDYQNRTFSTYYISNGKRFESYQNVPFADDVKMYNFSTNFADHRGEKTKVRVDDRIQAFYDAGQNKISHIYVLERTDPAVKKLCPHCGKKVTFYGYKTGVAPQGETTHYYIANDRFLGQMTVGDKDRAVEAKNRTEVILDLNGHTLNGSSSRNALVYGDLTIIDTKGGGGLTGNINGWAGCLLIRETGKVNLLGGTYTYSADEKYAGATVGGIIWMGEDTELNVAKGVKLINGRTSGNGGLIYMEGNAVANINGAELGGGSAAKGGNFYLTGNATLNIKNSTIKTGAATLGDNFYLASAKAKWNLENVTYDGGIAIDVAMNFPITGLVNWTAPVELRNGAKLDLTGLDPASKLAIDANGVFTTDFADAETAAKYLGCFTVPQDYNPVYVSGKALATELNVEKFVEREMGIANAIKDLDPAKVVAGTTCPMCGAKDITWVKQTGAFWGSKKAHIYYEGAVGTAEAPIVAGNFIGAEPAVEICVVMVNADIHTTGRVLMRPNNIFSFMGKGTLTSNGEASSADTLSDRGLFNYVGSPMELNLYGGNYQYTGAGFGLNEDGTISSSVPMYGVLGVTKDSVANIFNDTVIGNKTLDTSRTYYNVYTAGKVNMFGGTIQNGVSNLASASGNVTIVGTGALNMYADGGVITGGVALGDEHIGANITVNSKNAVLNLGDNIPAEGGIALKAGVTLPVKGKVEWTKPVYLSGGAKLNLTEMTTDSKMHVVTESVFTTDFKDAKTAESYLNCFTVSKNYKPVYVSGKALATELELDAFLDREMGVANAVKDLDPAEVVAGTTCPICGAKGITWVKKTGTFWGSTNAHIYYEGEVGTAAEPIVAGNFIGADEGIQICVALVNADIHTTGRVLLRPSNIFNFMGKGTLTSTGEATSADTLRDRGLFNFVGTPIELNLYGGNYQYTGTGFGIEANGSASSATPLYSLLNVTKDSTVNIFNDTVIGNAKLDTTRTYYNVYTAGKVNMFGGTIQNGVSNTITGSGNLTIAGTGSLNMYDKGGVIKGGVAQTEGVGANITITSATASVNLGDTVLAEGGIAINAAYTLKVNGKVNWTKPVILRNNAKLDLTGMTADSKMAIDAEGVFTTDFADAETAKKYLGCFTVPQDYNPVYVSGKALATELNVEKFVEREMTVANAVKDLDPAKVVAGTTCPMCGAKNITWVKQTGAFWASKKAHIYYEGAIGSAEKPVVTTNFIGGEPGAEICVAFVNADIHTTGRVLLRPSNIFSFMGKGTLTSNGEATSTDTLKDRGLFNFVGSSIELNLYGGNYRYTGTGYGIDADGKRSSKTPIYGTLCVSTGSVANIFNDVVIGNEKLDTTRAYYNVYVGGKLNMFGGTVQNGVSDTTAASGNVTVGGSGSLNMYDKGGVITGGAALGKDPIGTNITVTSATATVNLNNAVLEGGIAINTANTMKVTGKVNWTKPVILRGGAKLNLTEMDPESKITLDAEGVFTTDFADAKTAQQYLDCFTLPENYKPVYVSGKALVAELELDAFIERETTIANTIKGLDPAKVVAGDTCPMCGAKGITWVKKTGSFWGSSKSHIYYEGAVGTADAPIVAGNFIGADPAVEICVVMVNADIHTTGRVLLRPNNNFSFMGKGTLTSNGKATSADTLSDRGIFNYVGSPIELNLYGGNYVYTGTGFGINEDGSATSTIPMYAALNISSGSVANIFNDVVIGNAELDTTRTYYNVYTAGKLNMFGGTIQNGVSDTEAGSGNVTVAGTGSLNMYADGGVITGGVVMGSGAVGANITITSKDAVVDLGKTTMEGGIAINAAYTLKVNGKVNWTKPVILRNLAKLDLTGMTADSKLAIDAEGVFTTDFADAETAAKYLSCFTVPQDYNPVYVSGKALASELNLEAFVNREMTVANAVKDLDPAKVVAGTTCPICGAKDITWVKQTGAFWASKKAHIYYEGAVGTAEAPIVAGNFIGAEPAVELCVVMVNADIHTTGRVLLRPNNVFSFMGNGTLTATGEATSKDTLKDRGLFNFVGSSIELNLYGGNYRYTGTGFGINEDGTATYTVPSLAALNVSAGSVANIFNDVVIGNAELDTSRTYYNVYSAGKLNMFGGTIQNGVSDNTMGSGNVTLTGSGSLNMYDKGGVITGGAAINGATVGANLTINSATAVVNLGESIQEGGIAINAANTLKVTGKVNWTKPVVLRSGAKLDLTEMDPESKMVIDVEGVFTTDFADADTAKKYLNCFTVPATNEPVVVKGKTLTTELKLEHLKNRADAIAALDPAEVVKGHTCPMCGATGITWRKNNGTTVYASSNVHVYYEGKLGTAEEPIELMNLVYNYTPSGSVRTPKTMCIALVDADIYSTGRFLLLNNDVMNIMGNGTVRTNGKTVEGQAKNLGLFTMFDTNPKLNLYGGHYVYTGETTSYALLNVPATGTANIFNDVVIGDAEKDITRDSKNAHVLGTLNMFGGTIQNGVALEGEKGGNVTVAGNGVLNLFGGAIKNGVTGIQTVGGNVTVNGNGTVNVENGSIQGGTILDGAVAGANLTINSKTAVINLGDKLPDGGIAINAAYTLKVNGKVNWTKPVILRNNAKLDLTGMDPESKLAIDADGVFTTDFADAETAAKYLSCFTVPQDYVPAYVKGKALATELELEKFIERETAVANAVKDLDPAKVVAGTTCPICGAKDITWVKQTGAFWASKKAHIYYEGAVGTAEAPIVAGNFIGAEPSVELCVVMVNADIHTTGRVLLRPNNVFSFMGNGTLTATGEATSKDTLKDRGIFNFVGANIELNLYGGNYRYTGTGFGINEDGTATYTVPSLAALNVSADSVANIFNDVVIGNAELDTSRTYYNVYSAGKINMFGGTIQNGVSDNTMGSGNVTLTGSGSLNMYDKGGVITGGAAINGAAVGTNLTINSTGAAVNLGNTTINGGIAINVARTWPITGKVEWTEPVVLRSGAKLDLTGMDPESKMVIDVEGVFTTNFAGGETAKKYLNCFTVPATNDPVEVKGSALTTNLKIENLKNRADAIAALDPAEVVKGHTCPMCGATGITWRKNNGTTVYASSNVHIYYEGQLGTAEEPVELMNLVYNYTPSGTTRFPKTLCIALVDADVHTTGRFLLLENDVMNIMGNGTITSDGTTTDGQSKNLGLFTMLGVNPTLNLYGGNYVYTGTNPYGTSANGANATHLPAYALLGVPATGTANIFNDVVIGNPVKDTSRDYKNTYILGTLNMFGGTIQNGVALEGEMGGNLCIGVNGIVNMYAGTIKDGSTDSIMIGGNVTIGENGTLNVMGGTITGGQTLSDAPAGANMAINGKTANINLGDVTFDGGIAVNAAYTLKVNGKVNWTKPVILRGLAKLDLTGMDPESKLAIDVEGVFTTDFTDADTAKKYLNCFTVPQDYVPAYVKGKALATELNVEAFVNRETAIANALKDLDPATVVAGNTCPMCGAKNVTWVKKTGSFWGSGVSHIYYEGAVGTADAPIVAGNFIGADPAAKICVVMVDADIHTTGRVLLRPNNVFSFMGNGTLTATGEATSADTLKDRGIFNFVGANIELNLYGGNYRYTGTGFGINADGVATNTVPALAALNVSADSVANIFNDVVIGNAVLDTSRTYYNVYSAGKINMFGGTIQNGVSDITTASGNVTLTGSGSLNMYDKGGVITGGAAINGAAVGTNLTINSTSAVVNLGNTTINGGIAINVARTWPIAGKVNWTDPVVLRSGAKLDLTGMDPESKLAIDVEGVFTTEFADADTAKTYLNCFTVPATHKAVFVNGKALATELTLDAMKDRADAIAALDPATVVAGNSCPMCGATNIVWKKWAKNITNGFWASTDSHIYIQGALGTADEPCEVLNLVAGEKNLTICAVLVDADVYTTGRILVRDNYVMNIMGNGTIRSNGQTIDGQSKDLGLFTVLGANPKLNLYGGHYVYTGATTSYALLNLPAAGTANIFNDVVIGNAQKDLSKNYKNTNILGTLNMFGGTIQNGVALEGQLGGNLCISGSGVVNMYGGAVKDGATASLTSGGNITISGSGTLNVMGGTITGGETVGSAIAGANMAINGKDATVKLGEVVLDGGIAINAAKTWPITGKVNWTKPVVLRGGAKLDLTGMATDSNLIVDADGVFTTDFADAATAASYASCITLPEGYKPAQVKGKALSAELGVETLKAKATAIASMNPADIVAGNTCPMCGATNVTWVKKTGAYKAAGNVHIYYEGAVGTADAPIATGNLIYGDEGNVICVVLVNADIHTTGRILLRPNNVMNIMGTGNITSDGTCTTAAGYVDRGLFNFIGANIELNLFGGNYQYTGAGFGNNVPATTGSATYALLNVSAQSVANIFNDVVIGPAAKDTSRAYYNAYVLGTLNMFGGTIQNGVSNTDGSNGNVTVGKNGVLNMFGGTIKDGQTSAQGGNILLSNGATMTMHDDSALVTGGTATNGGGNIAIGSAAVLNMNGGTIKEGMTSARGGNILMLSGATLNIEGKNALVTKGTSAAAVTGAASSGGGNIATADGVTGVTITMNNGTISDGTATVISGDGYAQYKGGGNIFAWGNGSTTVNLNGGSVSGGNAYNGGSIYVRNTTVINIGKDAVISGGYASNHGGNIMAFNMSAAGAGIVSEGKITEGTAAKGGGNICLGASGGGYCTFTMNGGEISKGEVEGLVAQNFGGNLRLWDNANFVMNDGYIYGGSVSKDTTHHNSANIMVGGDSDAKAGKLTVNGGSIAGDIKVTAKGKVTLTGAPKIATKITLADGVTEVERKYAGMLIASTARINAAGLTAGADITVSVVENQVLTEAFEQAAAVAGCFKTTNASLTVAAVDNTLKAVKVTATP